MLSAPTIVLALLLTSGPPQAPAGLGLVLPPVADDGLAPATQAAIAHIEAPAAAARAARPGAAQRAEYAQYRWPLDRVLHDGLMTVNYTDLDPTAGQLDYQGGAWNYDGHRGHDFTLASFRLMDRGTRILAAASGTVTYLSDTSTSDRNCDNVPPDDGNWIYIGYGDGTFHEYFHLRRASMTVKLGDVVQPGELLGLVGSSGYSTGPHLHFESGDYNGPGGSYEFRDPSFGPSNPLPSLWLSQPAYAGSDPLWVSAAGVFTESEVRGDIYTTSYCDMMGPLPEPLVYGANEQKLCMWMQFQSRPGDTATITLRKPDGSVYGSFDYAYDGPLQFGWIWSYYFLQGGVTAADYGTWRYQVTRKHGPLLFDHPFTLGATTLFGPRFWPRGGRSFRVNGSVQRDTLRMHPLGPAVSYALSGAPAGVTLADSVVSIPATSSQPNRSAFFQVIATDGSARRDTAFYHLVDLSKPLDPIAGVPSGVATGRLALSAAPQPFRDATSLSFVMPTAAEATLEVHDLAGRLVRTLLRGRLEPGARSARWDGRDDAGRPVAPGLYWARLVTADETVSRAIVRLR